MRQRAAADMALFREAPSAALKVVVFAAVISWVVVFAVNARDCLSEFGACLVASPAVWIFWLPTFVLTWLVTALVMKALDPGQSVFPALRLMKFRETPYLRAKGRDAFSIVVATVLWQLLVYGLSTLAQLLHGQAATLAGSAHELLKGWPGLVLVFAPLLAIVGIVTRRVQGAGENEDR